jgi:(1->4)-alpha-D-glucan 1-alpha-D-glucosylmutase
VLSTKLLQLTLPGVADVYQGTEVTRTSLVDPDNRRPVDLDALAARLASLDSGRGPADLAEEKVALVAAALRVRRALPEAFVSADAGYEPLPSTSGHAVAFARTVAGEPRVAVVATRLSDAGPAARALADATVVLPPGRWRSALTGTDHDGGGVQVGELLGGWPVALLVAEPHWSERLTSGGRRG